MTEFQHDCSQHFTQGAQVWGRLGRLVVGCVAIAGWGVATMPTFPAIAASDSRDDFRRCASNLARLKLSPEEAALACSRNLQPEYLWRCVVDVTRTGYTAEDALNACRQVRQPRDMAYCVSSIQRNLKLDTTPEVLDSCRRSLLPVRYSDCVVGVARGASEVEAASVLGFCNDERYFPREVDPTFIPYTANEPSLLAPGTSTPGVVPQTPVVPAPVPQPAPVTPAPAPVRGLY